MGKRGRQAIIDIGSNSIRLVVFGGDPRAPQVLYDDKVSAVLGRGVVARGLLDRRDMALALKTLARFAALLRLVPLEALHVVATAAVRDAANGAEFLAQVRALGLPAELLSGEDEARASAWGVIEAHPGALGLAADLGGGSLELARIGDEHVHECVSFRLGVMPIAAIRAEGRGRLRKALKDLIAPLDWTDQVRGQQLFLVGGSWRALERLHIHLTGASAGAPVPAAAARALKGVVREMGTRRIAAIPRISSTRAAQLPHASALLSAMVAELGPDSVVFSHTGLREGLLFQRSRDFST
ncbi:Ppx/GppA phosphatase family protein [Novosphingobium sp. B 225]|uniref:Ppx/GppA phosphatase family protein n=1 Tax=Novosphingobium sp. B 225 TaxID=1961849 RepID=UPI000B4AE313|nr:hypothetical protein [Novosphingobium sp. B 225]